MNVPAPRFELDPALTPWLRARLITCWAEATNAGGSVGFVAPVTEDDVRPVARAAFDAVERGPDRLLVAYDDEDTPVAWLLFVSPRFALSEHWRTLKRVMVHPKVQGLGYGRALLREAERVARDEGWRALHLTVRGGEGLEAFYRAAGYREIGRFPRALRVGPDDFRDEVTMHLSLEAPAAPGGSGATARSGAPEPPAGPRPPGRPGPPGRPRPARGPDGPPAPARPPRPGRPSVSDSFERTHP